jgi:membrane protein DedA with SNARE-associated domain
VYLLLALSSGGTLGYLINWFERYNYIAPFCVLMLCGLGAPLPEEVTLIGCGFLLSQEAVDFLPITLVCTAAILLGDSIPFWLGHHYGLAALKTRWVAKVLHPERFAKLERRFADSGNWAVFTCRFLPGLRIPGYFVAGTLRMSYLRFLTIDVIGVALSVPTSIWVSWKVFKKIGFDPDVASKEVSEFNHVVWAGVALLLVGAFLWRRIRRRSRQQDPPTEGPPAAASSTVAGVVPPATGTALPAASVVAEARVGAGLPPQADRG